MAHLKNNGITVFLDVDLETLKARIDNFHERGIARKPYQNLSDLYNERFPLYVKYADIWIQNTRLTPEKVCSRITHMLSGSADSKLGFIT
jgi:shikimate kinase